MSFGRRLALFFVLIVLVPTLALVGMLLIVSEDSRQGKADARLAAGLDTALALYDERAQAAEPAARELAADPALAAGLRSGDTAELQAFADGALSGPEVEGVQVLGPADTPEAAAGTDGAVAFAALDLEEGDSRRGKLLVSVTSAEEFAAQLKRLTKREVVVLAGGEELAGTAPAPDVDIEPGETADLKVDGDEYRAHLLSLDDEREESLLVLGPRTAGGLLSIEGPVAALLAGFLLLAIVLAYVLARALTGLHSRVAEQAVTDPLTGLSNRRRMDQHVQREAERALRFGHQLTMLVVDADDFKRINDEHGHPVGDDVLETIADVVRATVRSIDFAARYGGDEMAVLLIETGPDGATIVADRLRDNVRAAKVGPLRRGAVTISVGVATLPECAGDVKSLIEAADQALLVAKRAGKDQTRSAPGRPRTERNGHGRRPRSARRAGRRSG